MFMVVVGRVFLFLLLLIVIVIVIVIVITITFLHALSLTVSGASFRPRAAIDVAGSDLL